MSAFPSLEGYSCPPRKADGHFLYIAAVRLSAFLSCRARRGVANRGSLGLFLGKRAREGAVFSQRTMSPKRPRRPRPPGTRRLITAAELARRRGVDPRTVRRWVKVGCPVARRGKAGHAASLFSEVHVVAWLAASEAGERAMVRSLIGALDARARRTRNDVLRLAEQYVDPREILEAWSPYVADVRQRAEALVATLAARLVDVVAEHPTTPEAPRRSSPGFSLAARSQCTGQVAA